LTQEIEGHLLRKNHKSSRPSNLLYLDTETESVPIEGGELHRVRIAWSCSERREGAGRYTKTVWTFHESGESLCARIETMTREKTKLYVLAHNVFFDLQAAGFFPYFSSRGWRLDFVYDSGLTYILTIRKEKKAICCLSTTNWYAEKLSALGPLVGKPKLDVDFQTVSPSALKRYCRRDCEIVQLIMRSYLDFIDQEDLGAFGVTKGSQALHGYRHRFMSTKVYIHEVEEVIELERSAYFGGRTEAFMIGEIEGGPFLSLDINSMYPFLMRTHDLPRRLVSYSRDLTISDLKSLLDQYGVIAEVDLETDFPLYAVRQNHKTVFPVGSFRAFLCTHGLQEALGRDQIRAVHQASVYEMSNLFSAYVDHFYARRQDYKREGNQVYAQLCKYLMNCLYGKFGQKRQQQEIRYNEDYTSYLREEIFDFYTMSTITITELMGARFISGEPENASHALVAIPAHITEAGRILLGKLIESVGYDRVLYCDTDCIKIRASDLERVRYRIHESEIGALALEEEFDDFHIYGCKDYRADSTVKHKGVPVTAECVGQASYAFPLFRGQASHLRKGIDSGFVVEHARKTLHRTYDKAVVMPNGQVEPFTLAEF